VSVGASFVMVSVGASFVMVSVGASFVMVSVGARRRSRTTAAPLSLDYAASLLRSG